MTILTVDKSELEKLVGKITPELEEKITEMGTPVEEITDSEVSVEVFPNRPDLLSLQNFARALNQFTGKKGLAKFKINEPEPNFVVKIEKSVKKVRPHTVCAIVKGMKFDEEKIKEIVEIQEKLHNSIGRKRKKLAIGVYPLEVIELPIRFVGMKPEEIKFRPLESPKEMNGKQILRGHPTGREYADLLKDAENYPVFLDAKDSILSMPPIINSEETGRISESTKDVFIECSGHNLHYLNKALNILIAAISEMGGKIYSMKIEDATEGKSMTPKMEFEKMPFEISDIESTLGIELNEKIVKKYLEKMGIGYESGNALIPPYRTDILHWVDLSEEIAIAHGYDNFEAEIPDISTIGQESQMDKNKRIIAETLAGLGLIEVSTFHLTTKKNIKKMHFEFKDFIEVEDSKTERDVLRMDLTTGLLQVFSENSDSAYPQNIFEMGRVFEKDENSETGIAEKLRLAIGIANETISFTELKRILDNLFKMLDIEYSLEAVEDSNYILGRAGKIMVKESEVGRIGEVAPRVLKNWKIKVPAVSLELNVEKLFE